MLQVRQARRSPGSRPPSWRGPIPHLDRPVEAKDVMERSAMGLGGAICPDCVQTPREQAGMGEETGVRLTG